ncbi:DUF935 family protein, partial [Vibrio parahaemolyticus]|nr:DUF935 family protein [Vibrio parahaemolyticus]
FDLMRLAQTLTRDVIYPLYALNGKSYQHPRRHPRLEFEIAEPEDVKALSDSLPGLVGLGMRIPLQWLHDKTQIPMAKDGEPALVSSQALESRANPSTPVATAKLNAEIETDVSDEQIKRLRSDAAPLLDDMLAPVRELVESATSLSALRDDILSLQGVIGIDLLADEMAKAMAAAELAGISDVEDGI